jgi:hypothetical protein
VSHYNRALLVLTALVAIGLGLAGTSAEVSKRAALSPVTPHSLPTFQIVYFLQGEPHLAVYGSELPQGATFYFEPSQEEQISKELSKQADVIRVNSSQHSRSRREQSVLLEIVSASKIQRYEYRAGLDHITPQRLAVVSGSDLAPALMRGGKWALFSFLLLLFYRPSPKR